MKEFRFYPRKKDRKEKKIWEIKYRESLNGGSRRKRVAEKKQKKKGFRF